MRTVIRALGFFICASLTAATLAQAQNRYSISVLPDETTRGELQMIASSLLTAIDGEAPRSLRKLAAGAAGELAILAQQRIDSNDLLTLDDGTQVGLNAGDVITISQRYDPEIEVCDHPGAEIHWDRDGRGQPLAISVTTGNGCLREIYFGSNPPKIITVCQ